LLNWQIILTTSSLPVNSKWAEIKKPAVDAAGFFFAV